MAKQKLAKADSGAVVLESPEHEDGFLDKEALLKRLPFSAGTLQNRMRDGTIPYVRAGRRIIFDWPSVRAALLRQQRGAR